MIEVETSVLGQIILYPNTHNFIMKLNPLWFSQWRMKVVATMQELYLSNRPINLSSIGMAHKEHLKDIAQMQNVVSTNAYFEKELLQLELKYKKNYLQSKIAFINYEKDLSEIIQELSVVIAESTVNVNGKAKHIVNVAGQVIDNLQDAFERGTTITGIRTGWRYLDKYIGGWNKGNMVIIAGRPGSGKTAIALTLGLEASMHSSVLFISLEMSKEEIAKRYLSLIGGVENYRIRSAKLNENELVNMSERLMQENIDFYLDDGSNSDINEIVGKIKLHKAKYGLNIVFIDYIQLIKSHQKVREQEIAHISRTLKLLAKELEITIVGLAQLSRETEKRSDKKPLLSDLRESGQIEQDADIILFPFRPAYYADEKPEIEMDAELIIGKNRHGQCVSIPMSFEGAFTRYKEII